MPSIVLVLMVGSKENEWPTMGTFKSLRWKICSLLTGSLNGATLVSLSWGGLFLWALSTNDVVALDDGRDPHPRFTVLHPGLHPHDLSLGPHEHVAAMRYLAGQSQSNIKF